jgi:tRNA (adenine37-N6)-methyltransferase
MSAVNGPREGEVRLSFDPALQTPDAGIVFIGHAETPWAARDDCPKNMREARERGKPARLHIKEPYRAGLARLERFSHILVLTWFDRAERNLIVQNPRHASEPSGTFALRSPARPNPVGVHAVAMTGIDAASGIIGLEALDALDGTPIIDIKPYLPTVDRLAAAAMPKD